MNTRHLLLSLVAATTLLGFATWLSTAGAEAAPAFATAAPGATSGGAAVPDHADVPADRQSVAGLTGHYAAAVGATFSYELTGTFDYALRHPEGGAQSSGMRLHAELQMVVLDRRDRELLVGAELRDLVLAPLVAGSAGTGNGTGGDDGAMAAAAARPVVLRLCDDGRVLGYQFAEGLHGEQRNFVRGLFAALLHTVPADAAGAWEAEDADAAGTFVARWSLQADGDTTQVERTKVRYTAMAGPELHPHRITGGSRATFARDCHWLRSVDVDERTALTMTELGLCIDLHTVLHAALVAHGSGGSPATAGAWASVTAPAAGHGEDLGEGQEAAERARWQQQLAGVGVDDVTAELAALLAAVPQDPQAIDRAWQALIWLVKLDPALAASFPSRVLGMPAQLADLLISALGAAGTEAAEGVLLAMRGEAGSTAALRTSATVALFQLGKPSARVFAALVGDLEGGAEFTGDRAMGMLLLGTLAPRAGAAATGAADPFTALLGLEGASSAQGRADLWLNALGNTGAPAIVPHCERHLGDEDERVRAAACNALRLVDTQPARELLERGLGDPSPAVRTDAVQALGQHRSAAACTTLIRVAAADAEPAVRRATLDGLASFAKTDAAARAAIERMAASDADADNQRVARQVLEGLR
jgi:hypothetical protein